MKAFSSSGSLTMGDTTGMDLRDYFAAHCPESEIPKIVLDDVAKYLSKPSHMVFGEEMTEGFRKLRALARYRYADAMLGAREVNSIRDRC